MFTSKSLKKTSKTSS